MTWVWTLTSPKVWPMETLDVEWRAALLGSFDQTAFDCVSPTERNCNKNCGNEICKNTKESVIFIIRPRKSKNWLLIFKWNFLFLPFCCLAPYHRSSLSFFILLPPTPPNSQVLRHTLLLSWIFHALVPLWLKYTEEEICFYRTFIWRWYWPVTSQGTF